MPFFLLAFLGQPGSPQQRWQPRIESGLLPRGGLGVRFAFLPSCLLPFLGQPGPPQQRPQPGVESGILPRGGLGVRFAFFPPGLLGAARVPSAAPAAGRRLRFAFLPLKTTLFNRSLNRGGSSLGGRVAKQSAIFIEKHIIIQQVSQLRWFFPEQHGGGAAGADHNRSALYNT